MSIRFPSVEYPANVAGTWQKHGAISPVLKRLLDVVASIVLLIVLLPVMVVIALVIRLDSVGPIVLRQERVARQRKQGSDPNGASESDTVCSAVDTFTCYKFRSMHVNADDASHRRFVEKFINGNAGPDGNGPSPIYKLTNDRRVTRVGRFIRCTSLDELPQLFNVLKGEMSLVGPRPPLPYEVAMYKPYHWRRLEVLPGLTGLWQVQGRSKVTFDEMVLMDVEYIDKWSLWLDLKILMATLPAVIRRDGAA